jgi:hypothetical protein
LTILQSPVTVPVFVGGNNLFGLGKHCGLDVVLRPSGAFLFAFALSFRAHFFPFLLSRRLLVACARSKIPLQSASARGLCP